MRLAYRIEEDQSRQILGLLMFLLLLSTTNTPATPSRVSTKAGRGAQACANGCRDCLHPLIDVRRIIDLPSPLLLDTSVCLRLGPVPSRSTIPLHVDVVPCLDGAAPPPSFPAARESGIRAAS